MCDSVPVGIGQVNAGRIVSDLKKAFGAVSCLVLVCHGDNGHRNCGAGMHFKVTK